MSTTRAIVLTRGLGTRMQAPDPSAHLTPEQQRVADAGLKAMIPVNGRPFLDYILSSLADAGIRDVALVVGPEHDALRRYYQVDARPVRVRIGFVVQDQALGTANAVLAAERWVQGEPFIRNDDVFRRRIGGISQGGPHDRLISNTTIALPLDLFRRHPSGLQESAVGW